MRYVSIAYGTLEEITQLMREALGGQRSPRRQREARQALEDLEAGDTSVTLGMTTYLVVDNPDEVV